MGCANMYCPKCELKVLRFRDFKWKANLDILFFRNYRNELLGDVLKKVSFNIDQIHMTLSFKQHYTDSDN